MIRLPPISTRTAPLFPHTTLFDLLRLFGAQVDAFPSKPAEARVCNPAIADRAVGLLPIIEISDFAGAAAARRPTPGDRKSKRLNSSHSCESRMPPSA